MANRIKISNPDTLPKPPGAYSHVARVSAGELLFIAGQVVVHGTGKVVGADDDHFGSRTQSQTRPARSTIDSRSSAST
ncbi:MAG: hypothetical protein ACXWUB_06925 [Burkholderiales bacterium]